MSGTLKPAIGRWFRNGLWTLSGAAVIVVFYSWFTMLSPWGYSAPDGLQPIDESRQHRLFVFGTLRSPVVRWIVMGRTGEPEPAILAGYQKEALDITPAPGGEVHGYVLMVSPQELARLDRYERLGIRYERIKMSLADDSRAWVYRRIRP